MSKELEGRVAIVTGAGSGIGQAIAETFLGSGAIVIATDINKSSLDWASEAVLASKAHVLKHDVTEEGDWADVTKLAEEVGQLDILVNNAGIMLDTPFASAPIEDLRLQYRINVEGPFIGMQSCAPLLARTARRFDRTSSIINISSIYGQIAGDRYAAYSASKGAIRMLSKAAANELANDRIRVNSVHPGPTATKLGANHAAPTDSEGNPLSLEQIIAAWNSKIPMRRLGNVGDIAPVVAFLASDGARYMTGGEIVVDGGYSAI